ncbi:hypothetical protein LTR17_027720 [Elasticomyces elasticus]|nr:hypothetical protein LTR17_027720 [Elasticomyces elasticus]
MSSSAERMFVDIETGLTIGRLAGIISGITTILMHGFPLFAIYFMAFLVERRKGAKRDHATWTTIGWLIQSSMWPTLLQSVPNNLRVTTWPPWRRRIAGDAAFFGMVLPCGAALFVIASFLTPQGLRVKTGPARHFSLVEFQQVPDDSYYGKGSQLPPTNSFQRFCGWVEARPCPGHAPQLILPDVEIHNSTLPSNITTLFTSGTKYSTIAGPLDITPRHWYERNFSNADSGTIRAVGGFQPMTSLLLDDAYVLVQGLIVDVRDGGIGIRNHTMPSNMRLGAEWMEDILWIRPTTSCVDTNLSFHYQIPTFGVTGKTNGYIQDDGGLYALAGAEPWPAWDENGTEWQQLGARPALELQAYHAAWWNNQLTAQVLDINSSTAGQQLSQQSQMTITYLADTAIKVSSIDGTYLDDVWQGKPVKSRFAELSMDQRYKQSCHRTVLTPVDTRCAGYDDADNSIYPHAFIKCGYLFGTSQPEGGSLRRDLLSKWSQKLYVCASAVQASVQTVRFRYNGTNSLPALKVLSVSPKVYSDKPPTFAVEKRPHNFTIRDIDLLWGVVGSNTQESDDIRVYHTEDIFLPAGASERDMAIRQVDTNMAGRSFQDVWHAVYSSTAGIAGTGLRGIPKYAVLQNPQKMLGNRLTHETATEEAMTSL